MKFGKAEVNAMAEVLDGDYGTVEEAAQAALVKAEDIFRKRAKFAVVGQLAATRERGSIEPGDSEAIKVSLGWYSTEGDATSQAESLWHSTVSGDEWRTWVLPVHHGTAGDMHAKQKAAYAVEADKREEKALMKLRTSIAKRAGEAEERNGGGKGSCTCGHQSWWHKTEGSGRGACVHEDCTCPKWQERK